MPPLMPNHHHNHEERSSSKTEREFIDVSKTTLDEWLDMLKHRPNNVDFIDCMFPSATHRSAYLASLGTRSSAEVKWLLHHLLPPGAPFGSDEHALTFLMHRLKHERESFNEYPLTYADLRLMQWKRTKGRISPRESIYWVIDLVDVAPQEAISALNAFALVHAVRLPDWRLSGLFDAIAVIRTRCLVPLGADAVLDSLLPRDMECLTERLYAAMGYQTSLTPPSRDGGRDVIAVKSGKGFKERVLVDVKHYRKPVKVEIARQILGIVNSSKDMATKGVIISTGRFTRGALKLEEEEPRLELICREQFISLLNRHLGRKWMRDIGCYERG